MKFDVVEPRVAEKEQKICGNYLGVHYGRCRSDRQVYGVSPVASDEFCNH